MNKHACRTYLRAAVAKVSTELRTQWDISISHHLLLWARRWCRQTVNPILGVYWPIHYEPDLQTSYTILRAYGITLALPAVLKNTETLTFFRWEEETLDTDACGIPIPAKKILASPSALWIPCPGFDKAGRRLGYGQGNYDKTLAAQPELYCLGIAYAMTEIAFEATAQDLPMHAIVTEKGWHQKQAAPYSKTLTKRL